MAAGDFITYDGMWKNTLQGLLPFSTGAGEFGCWILLTTAYTPDQGAHETYANVSANELSTATDYDRVLANTVTISTAITASRITVDMADVDFGASVTISAKYAALVYSGSNGINPASSDLLVGYVDLNVGGDAIASAAGPFNVNLNASGLFDVGQST